MRLPLRLRILVLLGALLPFAAMAAPPAARAVPATAATAAAAEVSEAPPVAPVRIAVVTSLGRLVVELDAARAPATVANFLAYADAGHYSGTIFHRVVPGLLVQGGAFTPDLQAKPERAPVPLEAGTGLSNLRGTVAAARRPDRRDSATAQFFINVVDNPQFDALDPASDIGAGYAVFGRVLEGMEIVERMSAVETAASGPFAARVPTTPIVIERVERLGAEGG